MRSRLASQLSANFLQLLLNQGFALLLFLVLSRALAKAEFGALNWALGVLLLAYNMLAFGLEPLLVKKIAEGKPSAKLLPPSLLHIAFAGLLFTTMALLLYVLFPARPSLELLALLAIGRTLLFFSAPFKFVATGQQQFGRLLRMSVVSGAVKALLAAGLTATGQTDVHRYALAFILADAAELLATLLLARGMLSSLSFKKAWRSYTGLLREALPGAGTVCLAALLARADWIFLGIYRTDSELADYSFAYKLFEVAGLPLLIFAPLLLPHFVKRKNAGKASLLFLLRMQLLLAALTLVLLNLLWVPVVGGLTGGRYGESNRLTIALLSAGLPLLYCNNLFWTRLYARGHHRRIFRLFAASVLVNGLALALLVPPFGKEGAAAAYLLALLTQAGAYLLYSHAAERKDLARILAGYALFLPATLSGLRLAEDGNTSCALAALVGAACTLPFWIRRDDARQLRVLLQKQPVPPESVLTGEKNEPSDLAILPR